MTLRTLFIPLFGLIALASFAQDTIVVQTFTWDSTSRAAVFTFPDDPGQTYRKILMRYNMRCHDAAVGSGNVGCYEWDYSCNTFLTDSSRVDSVPATHPDHIISNFSGTTFSYTTQPTYTYLQFEQFQVDYQNTISENTALIGANTDDWSLENGNQASKVQSLYTAAELQAAGLSAGPITGMRWQVTNAGQAVSNLRIRMKATTKTELTPNDPDLDGFEQVYFLNTTLNAGAHSLRFHENFEWDGLSNILVEYSFTQSAAGPVNVLEGSDAGFNASLIAAAPDNAIRFAGTGYVDIPPAAFAGISNEVTLSFWSYGIPDALPANTTIFEGVDGANRRQINVHLPWSNSQVYWDCGNDGSGYDRINKAANPEDFEGSWNHWAFTKNATSGEMRIYLNGQLWHSGTGKTKPIQDIASFYLGLSSGFNIQYFGAVHEFRIWDKALDAATIQAWMYQTVTNAHPDYSHLVAYYPFDEGTGSTAGDAGPNDYDAAILQYPSWQVLRGDQLYKNFTVSTLRPVTTFVSGEYDQTTVSILLLDSLENALHSVTSYAVDGTDLVNLGTEYVYPAGDMSVIDEAGNVVGTVFAEAENTIGINTLNYFAKSPAKFEILSLVTPYGNGLDLGQAGKTFFFDVSDYAPILRGNKRMSIEMGGQNQEELDIQFWFITGTPDREVLDIQHIWPFRRGWYADIQNDVVFEPRQLTLNPDAAAYKVRCSVTGHGQNGEFIPRTHYIDVNGLPYYFDVWKECSEIPIYPQGGTWLFDRAGWCPGDPTQVHEYDFTDQVSPGETVTIDYGVTGAFLTEANYLVANQLVSYGPRSHSLDAAVETIARPSKRVEYERINPACNIPLIYVKNNGTQYINNLSIDYWVEGNATKLTHNFQGSISPGESWPIELPVPFVGFWKTDEAQVFHAEITSVNGQSDEYADNDRMSSPFDLPLILDDQQDLILKIRTNAKASENYYTIKDHSGAIVASRYSMANNTTYEDDLNLPPGCYSLHFEDLGDDGLYYWFYPNNGNGYVRIQHLISGVAFNLHSFESEFGGSLKFDFVVGEITSTTEIEDARVLSVFPNPAYHSATIELSGFEAGTIQLELTDMLGRSLWQSGEDIPSDYFRREIDLQDLPAGLYFVRVQHGNRVWVKEVVKG